MQPNKLPSCSIPLIKISCTLKLEILVTSEPLFIAKSKGQLFVRGSRKKSEVHTICTNHPGGNLVHKHKTIKFGVVGEHPATNYIQIS